MIRLMEYLDGFHSTAQSTMNNQLNCCDLFLFFDLKASQQLTRLLFEPITIPCIASLNISASLIYIGFYSLPDNVAWLEPPAVCQWQENRKLWTTNYVNDFKYNEDKLIVQFRTGVLCKLF